MIQPLGRRAPPSGGAGRGAYGPPPLGRRAPPSGGAGRGAYGPPPLGLGPPIATTQIYEGTIVNLRRSDYRRPDGTVVSREVIDHPGAVVIVPVEDDRVLLVRQPREAVEEYTLELPAGKLDRGEDPLACARRELAEEVGRAAATWRDLGGFYTAPAILTEFIHCFLATGLTPAPAASADEDEAIEVVEWPLADLAAAIDEARDAKTLIGLLRLERELAAGTLKRPSPGSA